MFMRFFTELREAKVPVTLKEYLVLMEAMDKQVIDRSVDDFYYLSRSALVKDEKNLDKFDRVFAHVFQGLEKLGEDVAVDIPAEWLKRLSDKFLTEERFAKVDKLAGIAESEGLSMVELALGWLKAQSHVTSIIAGATSPDQVRSNARASNNSLSDQALSKLDSL